MRNQAKKNKHLDKAERKFKRARERFEAMREQYVLVREHGKQQVERTQLEAERRLTKVNERLEKRARALNRAEARMLEFAPERATAAASGTPSPAIHGVTTPEAAADAIASVQEPRGEESWTSIVHGE